jgi:hypothetical protein
MSSETDLKNQEEVIARTQWRIAFLRGVKELNHAEIIPSLISALC